MRVLFHHSQILLFQIYQIQGKSGITYNSANTRIIYGQNNQNSVLRGTTVKLGDSATQHVTASGNISASGDISADNFILPVTPGSPGKIIGDVATSKFLQLEDGSGFNGNLTWNIETVGEFLPYLSAPTFSNIINGERYPILHVYEDFGNIDLLR